MLGAGSGSKCVRAQTRQRYSKDPRLSHAFPMCGRYYRLSDKRRLADHFDADPSPDLTDLVPHYNIAPTIFQPVIRNLSDGAVRELLLMRAGA